MSRTGVKGRALKVGVMLVLSSKHTTDERQKYRILYCPNRSNMLKYKAVALLKTIVSRGNDEQE